MSVPLPATAGHRALSGCAVRVCVLFCVLAIGTDATAQRANAPASTVVPPIPALNIVESQTIIATGSEWDIWLSHNGAPPNWPNGADATAGERADFDTVAHEDCDNPPDRCIFVDTVDAPSPLDRFVRVSAPIIGRSIRTWEALSGVREVEDARRRRHGRDRPTRTTIVYDADFDESDPNAVESGFSTLYATRSFQADPDSIAALHAEIEFSGAAIAYLNGREIFRANVAPGAGLHGAHATPIWLEDHVNQTSANRWQMSILPLDPGMLREGENQISVAIFKRSNAGRRPLFFDFELMSYASQGFLKTPYLQQLEHDRVTVSWESNVPGYGFVEYGTTPNGLHRIAAAPETASALHEVVLPDLEPNTRYYYRANTVPVPYHVGGTAPDGFASPVSSFRSSVEAGTPFTFIAYGDNRTQIDVHRQVVSEMWTAAHENDARFVLSTGDLVTTGGSWHEYQDEFFGPALPLMSTLPYYTTIGNHEGNHLRYYHYMSLPGIEAWYGFQHGDVDFFGINSSNNYEPGSPQYVWLEQALRSSTAIWKVAFFHHPPYACTPSRKPGDLNVQNHLVPLFEEHGVQLVILGHDHLYGRSNERNGVTYVISGGGGAPSYPAEPDEINRICVREHHYCVVDVTPEQLRLRAIAIDGDLLDDFTLNP